MQPRQQKLSPAQSGKRSPTALKSTIQELDNPDTAIFFEQQLERWLKITDRPVSGEIPR